MSTNTETVLTGGCQCGNVTYSSTTLPCELNNCHCQTCRRLSGAPFITFGSFPAAAITWTSGADSLKKTSYSDMAIRSHCAECGSPISMQYKCEPERISITAGSINEESVRGVLPKIKAHIFVDSMDKAGWYEIPKDNVPRYSKFSTGFQKKLDVWKQVLTAPGFG
jgi:hypothetical protein